MTIYKIGHCCLVIEVDGIKLMTDPGAFTDGQLAVTELSAILITHEHADHLHTESLHDVLKNNSKVRIITNHAVGTILEREGITCEIVDGQNSTDVKGVKIEAYDGKHEEIYDDIGQVQNTGYFIADKLFYPGDSFHNPERDVDVLALPVGGPWCAIGDAIRYVLEIKPTYAFPVHDGMADERYSSALYRVPRTALAETQIEFIEMKAGDLWEM